MRVSPVDLYARSLNEALELARISAAVTHNHPEGIKGAQAVAACIYMKLRGKDRSDIKRYVERVFGYNLSTPLEDIRPGYTFDVSCQGSVPVAIMAFLQRLNAEEALRLAVSMGGDSDTIACITCAIADAEPFYMCGGGLGYELKEQCRRLLPPDLLFELIAQSTSACATSSTSPRRASCTLTATCCPSGLPSCAGPSRGAGCPGAWPKCRACWPASTT